MTPQYIQWTIPSLLHQTNRKNPLGHKGLIDSALSFVSLLLSLVWCFSSIVLFNNVKAKKKNIALFLGPFLKKKKKNRCGRAAFYFNSYSAENRCGNFFF